MPLPGALIANVGDVVEVATNGKYKSVEHRAVVNAHEERVSIAAFHSGKFGTTYGPLEEVVGDEEVRYRSISVEEYVKLVLSSKLDGKNIMDTMKIT
jgi:isopenicillin N synthase-like dioxygenase